MTEEKKAGGEWSLAWVAWGVLFLIVELWGFLRKIIGATLSEHLWYWFCLRAEGKTRRWWKARRVIFYAFWLCLTLHFVAGLGAQPWLTITGVPFVLVIIGSMTFERREK